MVHSYVKVPTVDDWWSLTSRYPHHRKFSLTPLKDYGYMELFQILEATRAVRVLEFGHGLNINEELNLFDRFKDRELWGVDDDQGVAYFKSGAEWTAEYETKILKRFPWVKFERALLGTLHGRSATLPEAYFDVVCSVSVLEELPLERIPPVLDHAFRLLRPGGLFVNSHDIRLGDSHRYREIVRLQREAGFALDGGDVEPGNWDATFLLLENPIGVMLYYQGAQPEDRRFMGNFATMMMVAQKLA